MNPKAPIQHQPKAVLFDMDGVLYNSMKNHADTWVEAFRKFGVAFQSKEAYLNEGRTGTSTIEKVFRERLGREVLPHETEAIYTEKTRLMNRAPSSRPVEGIKEVIGLLREKGIKVIVVTGSNQPRLLNQLNQDFGVAPEEVVAAKDVTHGKPHPEPYLKGLSKANAEADQCMVIENAPLGIQSARSAGIFTLGLNTGILDDTILTDAGANLVFKETTSLRRWLEKLLE